MRNSIPRASRAARCDWKSSGGPASGFRADRCASAPTSSMVATFIVSRLTYDLSRLQCNAFGISWRAHCAVPGHPTMGARHFGARVARLEDPALLTGRGRFVDDIRPAGALHACFVRSPHAHAKIRAIDTSAARDLPGVHAVLTADDLPARMARSQIPMLVPNPSIATPRTQLALARREVCYVGQTIAVAIADNRYLAEDAAAAVNVRIRDLAGG